MGGRRHIRFQSFPALSENWPPLGVRMTRENDATLQESKLQATHHTRTNQGSTVKYCNYKS
ncbi:hypothetical protein J6590_085359 [Homalodisca vitripennis]|nr:hypothetical protein J6590_085359 [Homalodisca vitripennis]